MTKVSPSSNRLASRRDRVDAGDVHRWRDASIAERAAALAELLDLADAMRGDSPPSKPPLPRVRFDSRGRA